MNLYKIVELKYKLARLNKQKCVKTMKKIQLILILSIFSTSAYTENSSLFEGAYLGIDLSRTMSTESSGFETSNGVRTGFTLDNEYDGSLSLGMKGGYNWLVSNNIVFGFDGSYHEFSGDNHGSTWVQNGVVDPNFPASHKINDRADLKAKLGYVFNNSRSLIYLTSGYSRIEIQRTDNVDTANGGQFTGTGTVTTDANGWIFGLGGEHFIFDYLTMNVEYLVTDYGSITNDTSFMYGAGSAQVYNYDDQTVRFGLIYWFK